MKRIVLSVVLGIAGLAALTPAAGAAATGPSPAQLTAAHWACVVPPPHPVVHCLPPGIAPKIGVTPAFATLVFATNDPGATEATFLGTEQNLRVDIYERSRPPCPQDPDGQEWTDLRPTPLQIPYYACHHFDSPF
jgi:hypothetical protein